MSAALAAMTLACAASIAPIAGATTKHHHPPGMVKLSSIKIDKVGGVVCGNLSGKWVSGTVFSGHWFISDSRYKSDYLKLASHATGPQKKKDLKRARFYGKQAKKRQPICAAIGKQTTPLPPTGVLPSMGAEPSPSIFGIDTGTYDSSHTNFVNDFPTAQGLGARWDRFTIGQSASSGNYSTLDYEVTQARQHGMGVILSFGCATNIGCPPTSASDLTSYQAFVTRILTRYQNVVYYYESWIEPNHASQWGGAVHPAQYAALLTAQYAAFQSYNSQNGTHMKLLFGSPNGFTIVPGTSNDEAVLPFTNQVLSDLGGAKAFDGVALHAYRYPPDTGTTDNPSVALCDWIRSVPVSQGTNDPTACPAPNQRFLTWPEELSAYEHVFTSHGYGTPPLWLTEFGWPGNATEGTVGYHPSYIQQAADAVAAYVDVLQLSFVQGALWFNLRDYQSGISNPDPEYFSHFGLLQYNYKHKPAADWFKSLAAAIPNR